MATLSFEATPSDDLRRYQLAIDGKRVKMKANNKGTAKVAGECGDLSPHTLGYSLFGPAGAKLSVKVTCGNATEIEIQDIEIFVAPFAAAVVDFKL